MSARDALRERLRDALAAEVRGEVRFEPVARALYATDASSYAIEPLGVVLPLDAADVLAVLRVADAFDVPVLPRGGGTSLAGQAVGEAIVVDVSKHMDRVLDLDVDARTVRVEPGVVRDRLNALLAPHRLQFTPDVSTSNRANVGGMVANNSAGTRSVKYGMTVDQVEAMTVAFWDGTVAELRALEGDALEAVLRADGTLGDAARAVHRIVHEHAAEIEARFPKVLRRVGGYNLDALLPPRPFDLSAIVCGSEGTLAFILDVTLRLHPVPARRCLVMLHFDRLEAALEAVPSINAHGPSAVEIIDRDMFVLGAANPAIAAHLGWVRGDPAAVLAVEFDGDDDGALEEQVASLAADPEVTRRSYASHVAMTPSAQADILDFRRKGLGIYATVTGPDKPTAFIEDAAIPVEHLADYIPAVLDVCRRHGVHAVLYGHASVGVIHVRPHLDLRSEEGLAAYRAIADETFALVRRYGGSWSGEHGDGLARSEKNRELFGDVVYEAFREVKRAFDPKGRFNPGKVVDAPPMTESLRSGPGSPAPAIDTILDFSGQDGFLGAVELCTGVGECRKIGSGTMCPSYMATRDEDHSTRGRANVLRQAITGGLPGGLTSRAVHDVLDLCLECKACKTECPSRVDMAKLKYEFLQHYHDAHGLPLATLAIGSIARIAPLAQAVAPLANAALAAPPVRWLNERIVGVDRRRRLPAYARTRFDRAFARDRAAPRRGPRGTVALFADTWTTFNDPAPGHGAARVLEALGYEVELVPYHCCGRPLISKGLLRRAERQAEGLVDALLPYADRGVPVLGLEPSCVTALKDDYRDLLPGPDTDAVAANAHLLEGFLAKAWARGELRPEATFRRGDTPLLLHGHCQGKAVLGTAPTRAVLEWASSDVRELDAGCCGMAGSFGYTHHDLSMAIGESRLFPAARAHEGTVVASGFSCRHQIMDGAGVRAPHVAEVLASALRGAADLGDRPHAVP